MSGLEVSSAVVGVIVGALAILGSVFGWAWWASSIVSELKAIRLETANLSNAMLKQSSALRSLVDAHGKALIGHDKRIVSLERSERSKECG